MAPLPKAGKTCHSGGMSETGAVIHIVGADHRPGELLQQIVFLVGAARGSEKADAVGSISIPDPSKFCSGMSERLIPGYLLEETVLPERGFWRRVGCCTNSWTFQPLMQAPSLIGDVCFGGQRGDDPSVQDFEEESAAAGTVGQVVRVVVKSIHYSPEIFRN